MTRIRCRCPCVAYGGLVDISSLPSGMVVVAIDGSPHSARAVRWAGAVAERERRRLLLVHAAEDARASWVAYPEFPPVDLEALQQASRAAGERLLDEAAGQVRDTHPSVDVHTRCEVGDPREILIAYSTRAYLLVIGSRGRGPVRRLLLGSVAAAVTRRAACPVLVLRPGSETSQGNGVLVGVDGTEASRETLAFAFQAASWSKVPLTVLYCFWDFAREDHEDAVVAPDHPGYAEERALVSTAMAGLPEQFPDVEVRVQLARGLVDRMMLDLAKDRDLLVVGARSHGAIREALLGSVATTMLEYAPCPVAVVPRSAPA